MSLKCLVHISLPACLLLGQKPSSRNQKWRKRLPTGLLLMNPQYLWRCRMASRRHWVCRFPGHWWEFPSKLLGFSLLWISLKSTYSINQVLLKPQVQLSLYLSCSWDTNSHIKCCGKTGKETWEVVKGKRHMISAWRSNPAGSRREHSWLQWWWC